MKHSSPACDSELLKEFPLEWLEKFTFLPLSQTNETITIGTTEKSDEQVLLYLHKKISNKKIIINHLPELTINRELSMLRFHGTIETLTKLAKKELLSPSPAKDPAIKQLVELLFSRALTLHASDIHLEPTSDLLCVRVRIDGVLQLLVELDGNLYAPIVSVIKLFANLDITIKRKPQDGRFSFEHNNRSFDFRLSVIPTIKGESLVMRILDHTAVKLDLNELGLSKKNLLAITHSLKLPHGMILVTGPTGSGKSTTLYAMINHINSPDLKIITAEDPVEYQLPLIQQLPIDPKGGLGFPLALRHILRQDPDVIMVGEIRDEETLRIATQASLTGHQVFSTLHTNDAVSTIERMIDMGIEPYLISGTLRTIIAQRLVRKLCPHCKIEAHPPYPIDFDHYPHYQYTLFYDPKGCPECSMSGYKGRDAICEVLSITPTIASLISKKSPKEALLVEARQTGYIPMFVDGLEKASQGITSLSEVFKATYQGEIPCLP